MRITFTPEFLDTAAMLFVAVCYFVAGFFTGRDSGKKK